MNNGRFVIVGPPGMGKSTMLRLIPSVIRFATAIDLERLMKNGSEDEKKKVYAHVRYLNAMPWNGPLFLGNAAAYFPDIAKMDFLVIALHHDDHTRYMEWMRARDRRENQSEQGDHWESHRDWFTQFRDSHPDGILMIDPIAEFPSNKIGAIRKIAEHFKLALYRNPPSEPVD